MAQAPPCWRCAKACARTHTLLSWHTRTTSSPSLAHGSNRESADEAAAEAAAVLSADDEAAVADSERACRTGGGGVAAGGGAGGLPALLWLCTAQMGEGACEARAPWHTRALFAQLQQHPACFPLLSSLCGVCARPLSCCAWCDLGKRTHLTLHIITPKRKAQGAEICAGLLGTDHEQPRAHGIVTLLVVRIRLPKRPASCPLARQRRARAAGRAGLVCENAVHPVRHPTFARSSSCSMRAPGSLHCAQ